MFCNAWEHCADAYDVHEYQRHAEGVSDPLDLEGDGFTMRGGGFGNAPRGSGIPYRFGVQPDLRHQGNGMRVARKP